MKMLTNNKYIILLSFICALFAVILWSQQIKHDKHTQELKLQITEYENKEPDVKIVYNDGKLNERQKMINFIMERNNKVFRKQAEIIVDGYIETAKKYKIKPMTLLVISDVESSFNYTAHSGKAIGLLQVNPTVWNDQLKKKGIINEYRDYYDPQLNIEAGAFVLNHYLAECNKYEKDNVLSSKHFHTVSECAIRRYIGVSYKDGKPTKTSEDYYDKVRQSIGDYYLFVFDDTGVKVKETK